MAYVGSDIPSAAQPPSSPAASPQQLQMQYAIAKALMGNQPQFMQSRLQPLAQIANTGLASKLINDANAAQRTNAAGILGPDPNAAAAPGAAAGGTNPIAALFAGLGGDSGIPTLPGAPY